MDGLCYSTDLSNLGHDELVMPAPRILVHRVKFKYRNALTDRPF